MQLKTSWHNPHDASGISKRGESKPFGFAIDQEFARRRFVIDGDRDNNGLFAFGLRSQNFEGANFSVVALCAPVVQKILVGVRAAGLPKLVGFMVIALLQSSEKMRDRSFFGKITKNDVGRPGNDGNGQGESEYNVLFFEAVWVVWHQAESWPVLSGKRRSICTLPSIHIMLDAGAIAKGKVRGNA